jgi:ribonuclease E
MRTNSAKAAAAAVVAEDAVNVRSLRSATTVRSEANVNVDGNEAPEAQGDATGEGPEGSEGRRRRNRGRRGGERRERVEGAEGVEGAENAQAPEVAETQATDTAQATAPVASQDVAPPAPPQPVAAPAQAPVSAPAVAIEAPAAEPAPAPVATPYALPLDELQGIAQAAGLEWVNSDADKIMAAQEAIASEPRPVHVPRERKPAVVLDEGPLILVETRKDLSQVSLPFEQQA